MSRKLEDLHPKVRALAENLVFIARGEGIDIIVTCTYRSDAEQAVLYAQGRTTPGRIVTNAQPGQSLHNHRIDGKPASLAFDVVPIRSGKAIWDPKDVVWMRVGQIGESIGLEWAGRWRRFREFPHFQLRDV